MGRALGSKIVHNGTQDRGEKNAGGGGTNMGGVVKQGDNAKIRRRGAERSGAFRRGVIAYRRRF